MTSFIFNSKFINIFISLIMVIVVEILFRHYVNTHLISPRTESLLTGKPDLLLMGNSLLQPNVDKTLFDQELSRLEGRQVRTIFVAFAGTHLPLWYVIAKDHIPLAVVDGVPVGFISNGVSSFYSLGSIGRDSENIKDFLVNNDVKFFKKFYDQTLGMEFNFKSLCFICYYRQAKSKKLLEEFLRVIDSRLFNKRKLDFNFGYLLKRRYKDQGDEHTTKNIVAKFQKSSAKGVDESFIPEFRKLFKTSKLFFIFSHSKPDTRLNLEREIRSIKSRTSFTEDLEKYYASVIDLNQSATLNNPNLYQDNVHFNKEGIQLNSIELARQIHQNFILSNPKLR